MVHEEVKYGIYFEATTAEEIAEQTIGGWNDICGRAEFGCRRALDPIQFETVCKDIKKHPLCTVYDNGRLKCHKK